MDFTIGEEFGAHIIEVIIGLKVDPVFGHLRIGALLDSLFQRIEVIKCLFLKFIT